MEIIFVGMGKVEHYNSFSEVPYELSGFTEDLSEVRAKGACVHCKELDNQPEYKGWIGPMLNGNKFRYETQEVYDMLSR